MHILTLLSKHVCEGRIDVIQLLESKGVNIHKYSCIWSIASLHSHLDIVKWSLTRYIDIDKNSVLVSAATGGHMNIVKYLVDNGANIHIDDDTSRIVLKAAVRCGYTDIAIHLMDHLVGRGTGLSMVDQDIFHPSPFTEAVRNGHIDIIKYIVRRQLHEGAHINTIQIINEASIYGQWEVVRYFMEGLHLRR